MQDVFIKNIMIIKLSGSTPVLLVRQRNIKFLKRYSVAAEKSGRRRNYVKRILKLVFDPE